jgi:hypothetical protein
VWFCHVHDPQGTYVRQHRHEDDGPRLFEENDGAPPKMVQLMQQVAMVAPLTPA